MLFTLRDGCKIQVDLDNEAVVKKILAFTWIAHIYGRTFNNDNNFIYLK